MNESSDFLSFRKMVTPIIIQILFWLGVIIAIIFGIVSIVYGVIRSDVPILLYGLLVLILGPLVVRIYCEILILFFRINETLTEISNKIDRLIRE
jgi:hypothetical protein